jgi:hypothetical protein
MSGSSATIWLEQVYNKICYKLRLNKEDEEICILKLQADRLQGLRKKVLKEKFD